MTVREKKDMRDRGKERTGGEMEKTKREARLVICETATK